MNFVEFGDERVPELFWAKVEINGPISEVRPDLGRCWIWTATLNHDGYGRIRFRKMNNWAPLAHRAIWELTQGKIVYPLELDHLCKVRHCVNPGHLEVVHHAENVRRGDGGKNWAAKTHCPKGHPYDDTNTARRKNGARVCKKCSAAASSAWAERNREKSRESSRNWARNNKDQIKKYRQNHRDETNTRKSAWRAARKAAGLPPS